MESERGKRAERECIFGNHNRFTSRRDQKIFFIGTIESRVDHLEIFSFFL